MVRHQGSDSDESVLGINFMKEDEGTGFVERLLSGSRPGRVLTKDDRKFLSRKKLPDPPINKQTIRDKRYRIRTRVKHSFIDMAILSRKQRQDDREKIFKSLLKERPQVLKEVCIYLYLGLVDAGVDKTDFLVDVIRTAEKRRRGDEYNGDVSVDLFGEESPFDVQDGNITIRDDISP